CGGLTLIEVVVALTLASLLTLVLASLLSGTRASEAALDRTLDPVQTLDLASELLREEVALAGALPWPPATAIDDLPDGLDVEGFVSRALEIGSPPGGHRITVRYVDDRLADGPRARVVTFEAGVDARSEPQLYRRPGTAARQPLVEG